MSEVLRVCDVTVPMGPTPHALRHSFITLSLAAGVNVVDIAKHVGHANANITLKTYARALPEKSVNLTLELG